MNRPSRLHDYADELHRRGEQNLDAYWYRIYVEQPRRAAVEPAEVVEADLYAEAFDAAETARIRAHFAADTPPHGIPRP